MEQQRVYTTVLYVSFKLFLPVVLSLQWVNGRLVSDIRRFCILLTSHSHLWVFIECKSFTKCPLDSLFSIISLLNFVTCSLCLLVSTTCLLVHVFLALLSKWRGVPLTSFPIIASYQSPVFYWLKVSVYFPQQCAAKSCFIYSPRTLNCAIDDTHSHMCMHTCTHIKLTLPNI